MMYDINTQEKTMNNNLYIEDCSFEQLKKCILENETFKFKHKDTALYFTSDGDHLYAFDVDGNNPDVFQSGNFVDAIQGHYNTLTEVAALLHEFIIILIQL